MNYMKCFNTAHMFMMLSVTYMCDGNLAVSLLMVLTGLWTLWEQCHSVAESSAGCQKWLGYKAFADLEGCLFLGHHCHHLLGYL